MGRPQRTAKIKHRRSVAPQPPSTAAEKTDQAFGLGFSFGERREGTPGESCRATGVAAGPDEVDRALDGAGKTPKALWPGVRQGFAAVSFTKQRLAGRFTLIPAAPFPYAAEWQGLITTLEDALRLHQHPAGTLTSLDRYLHQRTGGMIGSLSHLIRGAAIEAILDGSEKITRGLLDSVDLDHAARGRPVAPAGRARKKTA
jgi:hypothetical protein